jgi:uncharacterized coiled-coil protein SlyX
MRFLHQAVIASTFVTAAFVGLTVSAHAQLRIEPDGYAELAYRYLGPPGNRVSAVAGVPGDPMTYYAGAASGGIWKTSDGAHIASVDGTKTVGVNRVTWNLRFSGTGEFGQGGGGPPGVGFRLLAPPGEYQVTLLANGVEHTQPLTLPKDPSSGGSESTIATQSVMLEELNADIEASKSMTEHIDTMRTHLDTLTTRLSNEPAMAELREQAMELSTDFTALADSMVQQKPGGFFAWPVKLTSKLAYLANPFKVRITSPPGRLSRHTHS